jgi:NAD(P)-dependent dehydrogenase (short-subunit alcohol dehydrogenase family)
VWLSRERAPYRVRMATALVTGGARGLGVEICRLLAEAGFDVWCTARDERAARRVAGELGVRAAQLHIDDPESVHALAARIDALDVLVNNAAIDYDTDQRVLSADLDRVRRDLDTNLLGAWRMAQAFAPHLRASAHGRLVNVSSGAGSITGGMSGSTPAYSLSKLALNGLTRMLAAELRGVLVNAVCPGWTATDMGGGGRPVVDGARSVVWACLLDDGGPTGGFYRDGRSLEF